MMTPEEQRELLKENGALFFIDANDTESVEMTLAQVHTYTAAVEARTRRQCANEADDMPDHCTAYEASEKIRGGK